MKVLKQISREITSYKNDTVEIEDGYTFSQYKLVRRIMLYKNGVFPTGKFDSQGNYKYWFDIISPRRDAEIKNIDFDTKDIVLASDAQNDAGRLLIANARLKEFLKETGQAEKLNEAIERGTEWGNVVYKRVKDGYKLMELNHFYVLNQIAEDLDDSDVIEEEIMTSSDLREKMGVWDNVDKLIESASIDAKHSAPVFYIYERNGEITERDFNEACGKDGGSDKKYVLAKVICGGKTMDDPTEVLYCDLLTETPYKEYHRGTYSNRWFRTGMYEILFDVQTRANEIGNQIARGLEYASKTIYRTQDRLIAQNMMTDLQNGDIIKSTDLQQVETRMNGLDQLIADWNRLMQLADKLANSYEVVTGENMPSGTPFSLAAQQNANANKLFDFIREKLAIVFQEVISEWVLPNLLKDLKAKDVIQLTNDDGFLTRYYEMVIDDWYTQNLLSFPPHGSDDAIRYKSQKLQEMLKKTSVLVQLEKGMWKNFLPRVIVSITGENYALARELESIKSFIALEQDPIRRTALIELAMNKTNIDVAKLPKTQQAPQQGALAPEAAQGRSAPVPANQ